MADDDIWDPNTWDWSEREYYIYLTPHHSHKVRVDYVDYIYFTQWLWDVRGVKPYGTRKRKKTILYAARSTAVHVGGVGRKGRGVFGRGERVNVTLYLHIEIMKRTGIEPPTPEHVLVDHEDGQTLDCRRINLRWATHSMNRTNRTTEKGKQPKRKRGKKNVH